MARRKSEATIAKEKERAIRRERRAIKKADRERRLEAVRERRRRREAATSGPIPKVDHVGYDGIGFSLHVIRGLVTVWCPRCKRLWRSRSMVPDQPCEKCECAERGGQCELTA